MDPEVPPAAVPTVPVSLVIRSTPVSVPFDTYRYFPAEARRLQPVSVPGRVSPRRPGGGHTRSSSCPGSGLAGAASGSTAPADVDGLRDPQVLRVRGRWSSPHTIP
jgi:hypothetical protein